MSSNAVNGGFGETEPMRAGPIDRLSMERVFLQPDRPLAVRDRLRLTGIAARQGVARQLT
jgi:hypothetical protein